MKIRSLSSRVILGIVICVGVITVIYFAKKDSYIITTYHQSQWNQFAPEIEKAPKTGFKEIYLKHVYGLVVSHHIPTTIPTLVTYYSRLMQHQKVKKFIIIGPDHTDAGKSSVTVSNSSFVTSFGEVKPIDGLAEKLQQAHIAEINENPFGPEHSVGSQILVISKLFPGAQVTPIILRSDTKKSEALALGKMLASVIDDDTVLVASVDFSHYLSTEQAFPIDEISGQVVKNLDLNSLPLIKADSGRSMATFMQTMLEKKAIQTDSYTVFNTNDFMQNSDYTTGYVFGFWGN